MSEFQPTIEVGSDAFFRALKHGVELWNDGSTPTFRLDQRDGRDGFTRYVNARIEGKLGEEAFIRFLDEYYGIDAGVDYEIYGSIEETDDGDLKYIVDEDGEKCDPGVEADIKTTKPYNSWLALRTGVLNRHPDDSPFIVVKLVVEDDLVLDSWEGQSWDEMLNDPMFEVRVASFAHTRFPIEAKIVGVAYPNDLTYEFEAGDRLFDPETGESVGGPLRRDNVAIPCRDLDSDREAWNEAVTKIVDGIDVDVEYI